MRILVTGASGLVGSFVAEQLGREGHDLALLLRPTSSTAFLEDLEYERRDGDVRNASSLDAAVRGVDAVVHCAGVTSSIKESDYIEANDRGTANLVSAALRAGVKRFVYVSSLSAQGPSLDGSMPTLDEPPRPIGPYGRSKLAGENHVQEAKAGMETVILRPPSVYGPRDRDFLLLFRAMGRFRVMPFYADGLNQISWINVIDCASAIAAAALNPTPNGAVYTIADGPPHTWRDLVDAVSRVMDKRLLRLYLPPALFRFGGEAGGLAAKYLRLNLPLFPERVAQMSYRYWICDNTRITADLGWTPAYDCDTGIAMTVDWYRQHGWM